jgi:hypothetical protein
VILYLLAYVWTSRDATYQLSHSRELLGHDRAVMCMAAEVHGRYLVTVHASTDCFTIFVCELRWLSDERRCGASRGRWIGR